jgi:hypothetical protein
MQIAMVETSEDPGGRSVWGDLEEAGFALAGRSLFRELRSLL